MKLPANIQSRMPYMRSNNDKDALLLDKQFLIVGNHPSYPILMIHS